jgi:L-ascorbate metabolism protein UlaG (beta-lactamase superfamily)
MISQKGKPILLITLILVVVAVVGGFVYLNQPQYTAPQKTTYDSPQYRNGQFNNPVNTPVMSSNKSQFQLFKEFLFIKDNNATPTQDLPSLKTNLFELVAQGNGLVWMGHSSYFLVQDGKTFLIDPVLSKNASPVPYTNVAFAGTDVYHAEDIPAIDYLLITHDHWDHLDYPTISAIKNKVRHIVVPLGVASYFEQWGFAANSISEGDWFDQFTLDEVTIHILPARHFSGRMLDRNKTLWASFAIQTQGKTFYFGGDSGYGEHFKKIQQTLGAIDYAILECGQYNQDWANIHMFPEQTAQAGEDLQAKYVLPSHNSKFKLSHHSWSDPLQRVSQASQDKSFTLLTPMIGQTVLLSDDVTASQYSAWWEEAPQTDAIMASTSN